MLHLLIRLNGNFAQVVGFLEIFTADEVELFRGLVKGSTEGSCDAIGPGDVVVESSGVV